MQKILVVDDAETNRELLRNMLENDYLVDMAEDGEQALQKLQEGHDGMAALLLDLHMPKADGIVVIVEMKDSRADHQQRACH